MRRICVLFVLLFFSAHELSAGFLPKRKAPRKPTQSGAAFNYRVQRGPQYSPAQSGSFSTGEVENLIQESRSPLNEVAQEAIGLGGGGSCDTSVIGQVNALTAQLQSLEARALAAQSGAYSCGVNTGCLIYYSNLLISIGNETIAIGNQLMGLKGRYEEAMRCQAQGGGSGGGGVQAMPPGVTYNNLAKRFKVPLGGGGAPLRSDALDQLQDSVDNAGIPDYDGRGKAQSKALAGYQRSAAAARAIGARVDAGRAFAGKPARDFSDPSAAARQEYLRINYEVLGPKYEKLAQQRSQSADAFADEVLASEPPMPLPSDEAPLITLNEDVKKYGGKFFEVGGEEAQEAWEGAFNLDKRGQALLGIFKVEDTLFKGLGELADELPGALAELGSGSLSTEKQDAFRAKLDAFYGKMAQVSQEAASQIAGYNPNPEAMLRDAARSGAKGFFKGR